jgi:hypothetical protein
MENLIFIKSLEQDDYFLKWKKWKISAHGLPLVAVIEKTFYICIFSVTL